MCQTLPPTARAALGCVLLYQKRWWVCINILVQKVELWRLSPRTEPAPPTPCRIPHPVISSPFLVSFLPHSLPYSVFILSSRKNTLLILSSISHSFGSPRFPLPSSRTPHPLLHPSPSRPSTFTPCRNDSIAHALPLLRVPAHPSHRECST